MTNRHEWDRGEITHHKAKQRRSSRSIAIGARRSALAETSNLLRLDDLPAGTQAIVLDIDKEIDPMIRRRLMDLGLLPGTEVEVVRHAPLQDPTLYRFADTFMSLRKAETKYVSVSPIDANETLETVQ
jgi:ferrous iron transport protein A